MNKYRKGFDNRESLTNKYRKSSANSSNSNIMDIFNKGLQKLEMKKKNKNNKFYNKYKNHLHLKPSQLVNIPNPKDRRRKDNILNLRFKNIPIKNINKNTHKTKNGNLFKDRKTNILYKKVYQYNIALLGKFVDEFSLTKLMKKCDVERIRNIQQKKNKEAINFLNKQNKKKKKLNKKKKFNKKYNILLKIIKLFRLNKIRKVKRFGYKKPSNFKKLSNHEKYNYYKKNNI
jgi:hypothetical protein